MTILHTETKTSIDVSSNITVLTYVHPLTAKSAIVLPRVELGNPNPIEVFTTTDLTVAGEGVKDSLSESGKVNLQVFELDGIQRIEARLPKDLSDDPDESRRVVLERFQRLREEDRKKLRNAEIGLTKASQYGVDRYPAIVFDGVVAVYGITDVRLALFQYRQWQEGQKP